VGAEYAFKDWRFVVSYLRDDQTVNNPEDISSGGVTSNGERRFFQSFVAGEVRYEAGGPLRGRLRGGYDATGEFFLLQPEITYRLWTTLGVTLFAEMINANRSRYAHN